jgi:hypothetical protein
MLVTSAHTDVRRRSDRDLYWLTMRIGVVRHVASIAAVGALLAGGAATLDCVRSGEKPTFAAPASTEPCPVPVITGGLPARYARESVKIGSLAIFPAQTYPALSVDTFAPVSGHGTSARLSAIEAAAVITEVGRVRVSVRKADRRYARLLFDRSKFGNSGYRLADGAASYEFVGCRKPYTQYQGGFVVARPGCIELDVRVAGRPGIRRGQLKFGTHTCAKSSSAPGRTA